ncbi:MAG: dynamin family protein [Calothrix sp. CSU_2_0]|nr:dynamin family protein [Calothrix sp. CSU_2_0]
MKSDIAVEQLRRYKDYGESILQCLHLVSENPPPSQAWVQTTINEQIQNLCSHAQKTVEIASSPVKIGIMGEFSSGKTLLLGSLIGYADALPVSETPTTGNVTAIHLVQQSDLQTTKVGHFIVQYLSHDGVRECLRYMLKEVEQRAIAAKFPPSPIATLRSLQPTTFVDAKSILTWCELAWNQTQSLELRSLLRELVIFVRTYMLYGTDICDRNYQVEHSIAKKGLRLAEAPMNILELEFERIPTPYRRWNNLLAPSAEDLQQTFSLIARIDVTVEVSREVWDLSSLQGTNEFILLDFPGLGAADSSVRDTFLSLRELAEVQTILLLLNGRYPGGGTAAKIRSMLERYKGEDLKDRIIVGVGRFNQLPLSTSDERALDILVQQVSEPGDDAAIFSVFNEPLSEEMVLEQVPILQLIMASSGNLTTEKKNIVLLSQLHGLNKLAEISRVVQVCSPEFLPDLEIPNKLDELRSRDKWEQLSELLPANSILSKQLSDYVDDGGIGRLRSLLREHVAVHGMKQLVEDAQRTAEVLRKEQMNLEQTLQEITAYMPVVENPSFVTLRQVIENLVTIYRQFQEDLDKQPIITNRSGISVSDIVKDELTNKIFFDWSEWTLLFDRTRNGIISLTKSERFFEEDDFDDLIPTQSEDFYPAFVETLREMQAFAHDRMTEAVIDLFSKISRNVELERSKLNSIILPEMEQYILHNFGNKQGRVYRNLLRAIEPTNKWQKLVVDRSGLGGSITAIDAGMLFPLAQKDSNHHKSQIFDWSLEKRYSVPARPFNHQIAVLRLRDEITASSGLHLVQYVSQLTRQVKASFNIATKEIVDSLQDLLKSKNEPLLRYIAAGEERTTAQQPRWLEALSQIVTISFPENTN